MDTSSPHDIEKLSDSISFSSRVSGSRSDPTLSTHDRLNESTKRKIVSSREDGDPSATAPTSPLGTLGRLPPELRIIIYKYVAEDCSILPNKQKKLSNMADRELFPHFLLTSKQLCREIIEFDEKFARPIIILVQSADGERLNWSLSDATDSTFASTWQKATELTIVAEYCPREGRWGDMLEHDHVFLALLYRNILVARDSRIRHDKVTHAHFIWYIDNWSKVQGSEKPRSTLHELVKNLIDDGIWDYLLGSKRFPNLTEVEIGIRSRSAATQLHYNYHFRMKDGKYIADTIFAAPSTQWSTLFVTCLTVVALYILKWLLIYLCLLQILPYKLSWIPTRAAIEGSIMELLIFTTYIRFFKEKNLIIQSIVDWRQDWNLLLMMFFFIWVTQVAVPYIMISALNDYALFFERGGKEFVRNFSLIGMLCSRQVKMLIWIFGQGPLTNWLWAQCWP